MDLQIHGKQVELGEALREHIDTHLRAAITKYFDSAISAAVTLTRAGTGFACEIKVHLGRGMDVHGHGESYDPYPAADQTIEHIAKRLRRYKRRLRDQHLKAMAAEQARNKALQVPQTVFEGSDSWEEPPARPAPAVALAGGATEAPEDEDPVESEPGDEPTIIAETTMTIEEMSVADAVMRLDLSGSNALLFRHGSNGGLNMVYRRQDGHIGWVDPSLAAR